LSKRSTVTVGVDVYDTRCERMSYDPLSHSKSIGSLSRLFSSSKEYARNDNLLHVVDNLFAYHDNRQLNGQIHNTARRIALHSRHTETINLT